jgi:uncharacterized membrane protein
MKKLPYRVKAGLWGIGSVLIVTVLLFIFAGGSGYFFPIALLPLVAPGALITMPWELEGLVPERSIIFIYLGISVVFYFTVGVLFGPLFVKFFKVMKEAFKE